MELPLTPSARPRRAPRRSSGGPGAGERRRFFTGRKRLRDEPPYETEALGRAFLRDEPPYGPEALTGRLRTEALSGPLRDEPPCAEALTDELPYTNGTSPSRAGGAYGTSPYGGAYGTSVLRAGGAYGTSPFTGRNYDGGLRRRYGTSLLAGPTAFTGRPITGRNCFLTDRRGLQNEPPYGPEALTGRATGRRRLRDEPPYRTDRAGTASLRDGRGGSCGTSLLTQRRH